MHDGCEFEYDSHHIDILVFRDITFRGVAGSSGMFQPVIKLMSSGMLDFLALITGNYTQEQFPQARKEMNGHDDNRIKFMINY